MLHKFVRSRFLPGMLVCALALTAAPAWADSRGAAAAQSGEQQPRQKLSSDEAMRQGMEKIARIVGEQLPAIRQEKLAGPAYLELAGRIDEQIAAIQAVQRPDKAAQHTFNELLSDMKSSLGMIKAAKRDIQRAGVLALVQSLNNYGRIFDHPGWQSID